jgi:hypothetical protein
MVQQVPTIKTINRGVRVVHLTLALLHLIKHHRRLDVAHHIKKALTLFVSLMPFTVATTSRQALAKAVAAVAAA